MLSIFKKRVVAMHLKIITHFEKKNAKRVYFGTNLTKKINVRLIVDPFNAL